MSQWNSCFDLISDIHIAQNIFFATLSIYPVTKDSNESTVESSICQKLGAKFGLRRFALCNVAHKHPQSVCAHEYLMPQFNNHPIIEIHNPLEEK